MTETPDPSSPQAGAPPPRLLRVAVPSPLRRAFDYLPPPRGPDTPLPGARVRVPFGRGARVGVVLEHIDHTDIPPQRLKRITATIDPTPILDTHTLGFLRWASDYFHHPVGEVVLGALPAALRAGKPLPAADETRWRLTTAGRALDRDRFRRAPRQGAVWALLAGLPEGAARADLAVLEGEWRSALGTMTDRGWVETFEQKVAPCGWRLKI